MLYHEDGAEGDRLDYGVSGHEKGREMNWRHGHKVRTGGKENMKVRGHLMINLKRSSLHNASGDISKFIVW